MGPWLLAISVVWGIVVVAVVWLWRGRRMPQVHLPDPVPEIEEGAVEPAVQDFSQPGIIDPNNPPHFMYYRPRPGSDPEKVPRCNCHGLPFVDGEKVLVWPILNHPEGGMDLFCAQVYRPLLGDDA